jgi:thiamine-phosphate pyrophosphorylase
MLLYYITDRRQFRGSAEDQKRALLQKISEAAHYGVDYIQLREKDLNARELLRLASEAMAAIRNSPPKQLEGGKRKLETRLLVNSRSDVAIASGANGVHLRADDISAADARVAFSKSAAAGNWKETENFLISVSCHTADNVRRAESEGADVAVFAPVFEKGGQQGVGLAALRAACRGTPQADTPEPSPAVRLPVLALGGVTLDNAHACIDAGAAGIAGIRLFQQNDIAQVVARLRGSRKLETAKDPV